MIAQCRTVTMRPFKSYEEYQQHLDKNSWRWVCYDCGVMSDKKITRCSTCGSEDIEEILHEDMDPKRWKDEVR